jgi:asparagine synthase (glutamine-hydrolysing)
VCGIAGVFGFDQPDDQRIARTLALMRNRGPDANGFRRERVENTPLALLHTRLSIIDLDARSNQPFEHDDCVLICNGEIYNYIELRNELIALGHSFRTESDTEVIVCGYRQYGIEGCLDRFEGMWAFALLDRRAQLLILSRDRFGEKPLYFAVWDGSLYFGSEVKFLAALSDCHPPLNENQVRRYLVNGYKSLQKSGETFYRGIYELPASSYAMLRRPCQPAPKQYWKLSYQPCEMTAEQALEGTRERLFEAMRLRLRSDVPVAFCLSGGVDSATLASIATKCFGQQLHTFSVIDDDPRYDERSNISAVVADLGCVNHRIHASKNDFQKRMADLVAYHAQPVATVSYYMHSFLSEAIAASGFKVALSGTGADEILTGYYDHYLFWLAECAEEADGQALIEEWRNGYGRHVRNPFLQDPLAFARNPASRRHIYLDADRFASYLTDDFADPFTEHPFSNNLLRNRMLNELFNEVVPVILREDDLNSMAVSVENRSPYLDRNLAEFLFTIPNRHLISNGYPKWLLRAAGGGIVSDVVRLDRIKRGFNASMDSLIDRSDRKTREWFLDDSPIFRLVRRQAVEEMLDRPTLDDADNKYVFSFISAKMFLDSAFTVSRDCETNRGVILDRASLAVTDQHNGSCIDLH